MKKRILLIISILFVSFISFNFFSSRIVKTSGKTSLTEKEIKRDCKIIKKYLKEAYIAYNKNLEEGFDIDDCIKEIHENAIKKKDRNGLVTDSWFMQCITEQLGKSLRIYDRHLSVKKNDMTRFVFNNKKAFYSDIFFNKRDNEFYVVKSNDDRITLGSKFSGQTDNLVRTIHNGIELYQYVVFSSVNISFAMISVNEESIKIPVGRKNMGYLSTGVFDFQNTDNYLYLKIGDFNTSEQISALCKKSEECYSDKDVILDLRGNNGGDSRLMVEVLSSLLFKDKNSQELLKNTILADRSMLSPLIVAQKSQFKPKYFSVKNIPAFVTFLFIRGFGIRIQGNTLSKDIVECSSKNVYVLTNQKSSSTSELAIALLKQIKGCNVCIIGENTNACMNFGNVYKYILPESGISISLACDDYSSIMAKSGYISQYGIIPDYWITDDNLEHFLDLGKE
ncbi:MAG: hypothetical protein K5829_13440 [Treponema sp.]|nr:hypothetical protein [Treponema sp.]